jgi:hypothetical protein
LFRCRKEDILRVTFTFPGDSSYTLFKNDSGWFAGDQKADSTVVSNDLNLVGNIDGMDINDDFKPFSNPDYLINFEGNNLLNASVKCFTAVGTEDYVLNSNQNPEVFFTSKKSGIFSQIVKSKKYFVKE